MLLQPEDGLAQACPKRRALLPRRKTLGVIRTCPSLSPFPPAHSLLPGPPVGRRRRRKRRYSVLRRSEAPSAAPVHAPGCLSTTNAMYKSLVLCHCCLFSGLVEYHLPQARAGAKYTHTVPVDSVSILSRDTMSLQSYRQKSPYYSLPDPDAVMIVLFIVLSGESRGPV